MNYENKSYMISSAKFSCGYARNDNHVHNDYELIFITNGSLKIQIADKIYCASKNNLLLITNLESHRILNATSDYSRYYITLRPLITDKYIRNPVLISTLKNHSSDFYHCFDISANGEKISALFENLVHNNANDIFSNELAMAYLIEILAIAYHSSELLMTSSDLACKELILKIQMYLDRHYTEDIKITDICKEFCISTCYLSHKFKDLTGFSPKQYLTYIRLRSASATLYNTKIPIGEVAFKCGFKDVNNFIKMFKREYGCLPSDYRKSAYKK